MSVHNHNVEKTPPQESDEALLRSMCVTYSSNISSSEINGKKKYECSCGRKLYSIESRRKGECGICAYNHEKNCKYEHNKESSQTRKEILEILRNSDEPLTNKQISNRLQKKGKNTKTYYVNRLINDCDQLQKSYDGHKNFWTVEV